MSLQLSFENPAYVSLQSRDKDRLVVELVELRDREGKLITDFVKIEQALPNQIEEGSAEAQAIEVAGMVVATGIGASTLFVLVVNLVTAASLNKLLSKIKNIQVIVHLPLLALLVPATA